MPVLCSVFVIIIFNDIPPWNRIHPRHLVVNKPLKKFPNIYEFRCIFFHIFREHSPEPDNSTSRDPNIYLKSILIL
jgi:hypothetical protein